MTLSTAQLWNRICNNYRPVNNGYEDVVRVALSHYYFSLFLIRIRIANTTVNWLQSPSRCTVYLRRYWRARLKLPLLGDNSTCHCLFELLAKKMEHGIS